MLNWNRSLAPIALALILSGCGGDGATTDSSDADVDVEVAVSDDDAGGGADLVVIGEPFDLADFPIDIADGGTVVSTTSVDETRAVVLEYPGAEFERLGGFYQTWSDGESDEYQRVVAAAGGIIYQNSNQEAFRSIIVSSPGDDGVMMLTLTAADTP